jgi:thiol-disulfide isomerase/thioredoxin
MKKHLFLLIGGWLMPCFFSMQAQEKGTFTLPEVMIRKLNGTSVSTAQLTNHGRPMIISFWATWCKPCIAELSAIAEEYDRWQQETGVKLIAISIDDARTMNSVAPLVKGKGWEYEVYLDPNGDLKRAMNVNMVPHTFLLNEKRQVVHQHTTYVPGDEKKLYQKVKAVAQQ